VRTITGAEMCRLLEANGWLLHRIKGSHHTYAKPGERKVITIPFTAARISSADSPRA